MTVIFASGMTKNVYNELIKLKLKAQSQPSIHLLHDNFCSPEKGVSTLWTKTKKKKVMVEKEKKNLYHEINQELVVLDSD